MSAPLIATALAKRYRRTWALCDCTVEIPAGSVTALVGPNGAGKSTLLRLAVGLATPTAGSIAVLGHNPRADARAALPRIGYVGQERPLYPGLTVAETCDLGERLNPGWDRAFAEARLHALGLDRGQRVRTLSGGQRAQVALVLALAKHPELLLLDEPAAALDPLARRAFMQVLMDAIAADGTTVVLSSHHVAELERVCDHLVLLQGGRVRLAEPIDDLLVTHTLLVGPRTERDEPDLPGEIVARSAADRQTTLLVRNAGPLVDARWQVARPGLEEIVLAYLANAGKDAA